MNVGGARTGPGLVARSGFDDDPGMARAVRRILLVLAGSLLAASLAAFGLFAWPQWSRARAAASWPVVEGRVVRCDVIARRSAGPRSGSPTYELDLLVRYEIDGVTLVTDREAFDSIRSSDESWYRARARELLPGTRVPVRHDPADPGFAVLRPDGGWIPFVLPGAFLAMSIVFALIARFAKPPPMLGAIGIPPGLRRLGAVLLGCLSLGPVAIGTFGLVVNSGRMRTLGEAAAWPEREATVLRSEWTFESNGTVAGARPALAYRYEIDGVAHESDSLAPVAIVERSTDAWNRRILSWRPGRRVTVRVDPADPTRSALEVPRADLDMMGLGLAVLLIVMGVGGVAVATRLFRRVPSDATVPGPGRPTSPP